MTTQNIEEDLNSIRHLMERSSKFISLSGLSGIMAGVYALIGAWVARLMLRGQIALLYHTDEALAMRRMNIYRSEIAVSLLIVALAVLVLSVFTGAVLSIRKARRSGQRFWNKTTRLLLINAGIPILTGGLFSLILVSRGEYMLVGSATLLFYGLALVSGSYYTFTDIKYLGLCEIVLGLVSALFPGHGLILWAIGFGLLHIVYGSLMYFKYDR